MSNHHGPECVAPEELRCEALVKARSGYFYEWSKYDHRCPKRANQGRLGRPVCHIHAKTREIIFVEVKNSS
jgi:hypothetical protein